MSLDPSINHPKALQLAIDELRLSFELPFKTLQRIVSDMRKEMSNGLKSDDTNIAMLPSWITRHPTGQESGEYLGLELNASYVRVYLVNLHGQGQITTRQQKYFLDESQKRGPINNMIDFLATSVDHFLTFVGKCRLSESIALGFVLSFPLHHYAINKAYVIQWTKDFEITGAEGKNIAELLQTGLRRRHIPVVVKAVINGSVGCLLAHSYRSLDTLLSCTISTGTNAAYWEKVKNVEKCKGADDNDDMIVNTEWGSFGDRNPEYLPRTHYDNHVNRRSVNPGVHNFEKMVSGLYLGEIARNIMMDFVDRRLLFDSQYTQEMNSHYGFETSYMSAITADKTINLEETKHILESIMNIPCTTLCDRQLVKLICDLVSRRAARLIASGISAIIDSRKAIERGLTISVEGTVYEEFPEFPSMVNEALREFYGTNADYINIGITRDGNGIGAALAAMIGST
ncbi:hexokinase-domain-containing protein [Phycomyces nitens]|nr:hexokinase-domain-containing protein [Phycomyces nitens]